ncbi:MAG: DUF192 domain-containing protein [Microgenomates group bacterium]
MVKQLLLPLAAVALFVILVGVFVKDPGKFGLQNASTVSTPSPSAKEIKVGNVNLNVSVADNAQKRAKGLSGTESLNENGGILFVFDSENASPSFWMKDMLIPLDIIWINDGKVVQIDKNAQPPEKGAKDSSLLLYKSKVKVDYVLEVNAGFAEKNNIKVGTDVSI